MKKQYQKPVQRVVVLQHRCQILSTSNPVGSVDGGDTGIGYGGGSSGSARARQHGGIDWDDWDE